MLHYPIDWPETTKAMMASVAGVIQNQKDLKPQLLSFGPSSASLFVEFKSHEIYPQLELVDLSVFRAAKIMNTLPGQQDGIAIVGMGVHFPKGHGEEELWETLSNGLTAVSEVRVVHLKLGLI